MVRRTALVHPSITGEVVSLTAIQMHEGSCGHGEPAPEEQKVVKLVRLPRKKGKSLREIADTLERRRFET